jgi:predicted DNA-binding transcriptional regulator AlpA
MTAARALPFVKIGHKVAYDEREVERWVASQARKSTSDSGMANA